eukprot:gene24571-biopygen5943
MHGKDAEYFLPGTPALNAGLPGRCWDSPAGVPAFLPGIYAVRILREVCPRAGGRGRGGCLKSIPHRPPMKFANIVLGTPRKPHLIWCLSRAKAAGTSAIIHSRFEAKSAWVCTGCLENGF